MLRRSIALAMLGLAAVGCGSDGERTEAPRAVEPIAQITPAPATEPVAVISAATAAPDDANPIVATVGGIEIRRDEIVDTLLQGYGLNVLMNVAQLDLAKQEAATRHLNVTPADITAENDRMLGAMFKGAGKDEYPQLLEQLLQQEHISRAEFDIFVQTDAYLHKIAEPIVQSEITEDRLQDAFKSTYGETIQVRHIQLANMEEVTEAKRRLANGEPFEQVAREMSRNAQTAPLGGELPPFSRFATGYPQEFKDVAFALKPGEVSDPVHAGDAYHLIQLVKRIPPKVVKYEDVKESLRATLTEQLMEARLKIMRQQMIDRISQTIKIDDPILKQAYDLKKSQADQEIHGKEAIREAIKRDDARAAAAATQTAQPSGSSSIAPPATQSLPEGLRPPATRPGNSPGAASVTTKP